MKEINTNCNNKEYLDILDINGNKTGIIKERLQAKKDKDIYKIVYLWIINNSNKILLQKRSINRNSNAGKWDCATAGHVLAGETSIDALKRETREELNLEIDLKNLKLVYSQIGKNKEKYSYHDVYILKGNIMLNKLKIQTEEIDEIKYFTIDEVIMLFKNNLFANDFHNQEMINIIKKEIENGKN